MTGIAMPADKLRASERCFEFRFAGTRVVEGVAGDEPILVAVSFAIDSNAIQGVSTTAGDTVPVRTDYS
jgi:hypothetical protein